MANEHDFNIIIDNEHSFDLTTGTPSDLSDSHSFSSTIIRNRLFELIIEGMETITSWFVRIVQGITIVIEYTSSIAFAAEIKLKRILIKPILSMTKKFVSEIKLKRIAIVALLRQTLNLPITITLKRIKIVAIAIMEWSLGNVTIAVPKIAIIDIIMSTGTFYPLWLYDPTELWTMDGQTLTALDYTAS